MYNKNYILHITKDYYKNTVELNNVYNCPQEFTF